MTENQAICVLNFNDNRKGVIYMYSIGKNITNMVVLLKNISLEYGKYKGLHLHECGDLTNGCLSACAHYNLDNNIHGGLTSKNRHYGDFGNIKLDSNGNCLMHIKNIPISIKKCVGRSIVLHEAEDDLGKGDKRYIKDENKINKTILKYLEYSNRKICQQIMGGHLLLATQLEDTLTNHFIELRRQGINSIDETYIDESINKMIPIIKDFVTNKILESKKTGNSGGRIGCGVLGYCYKKTIEELVNLF